MWLFCFLEFVLQEKGTTPFPVCLCAASFGLLAGKLKFQLEIFFHFQTSALSSAQCVSSHTTMNRQNRTNAAPDSAVNFHSILWPRDIIPRYISHNRCIEHQRHSSRCQGVYRKQKPHRVARCNGQGVRGHVFSCPGESEPRLKLHRGRL